MKKAILAFLMIVFAFISISFTMVEKAVADEMEEIPSEPIRDTEQMAQVEVQPVESIRQNEVLTETVKIPEAEVSEVIHELAQRKLEQIKANLDQYYTVEEIRLTTLIVQGEDLVAQSATIWSAHVWVILGRVGAPGFGGVKTITEVLSAPGQFSTWCEKCLSAEPVQEVEDVVRDVFARKILEDLGYPEEEVGRTVPVTHLFLDNRDQDNYNEFYRFCWGDRYDPFQAPHNPYDY